MGGFYDVIMGNRDLILDCINEYIAKAEAKEAETLKKAGFIYSNFTIQQQSDLEESITEALLSQREEVLEILKLAEKEKYAKKDLLKAINEYFVNDMLALEVEDLISTIDEELVPKLSTGYIKRYDKESQITEITEKTQYEFYENAHDIAVEIMENSHKKLLELVETSFQDENVQKATIKDLVDETIVEGDSIATLTRKILDNGWRDEYYQAKRIAVTEVLGAHSVSAEESIQQSPVVDKKEWKHTGSYKNNPRQNHVDMDGQIVDKDKPFTLTGKDGGTYYPMYPRDTNLPAGERINCHCIHRGIVNKDTLGMSLDERNARQEQIIQQRNKDWLKLLDEKNKAKAGITPALNNMQRAISSTNTKAADSWAKSHLKVQKTNYTKQDIKAVNKVNRALQRLYKEYPQLEGFVDEIKFTKQMGATEVAKASISIKDNKPYACLKLNPLFFEDVKTVNKLIEQQVSKKRWSPKRGLYGILKHEMVHMLTFQETISMYDTVEEAWKHIEKMSLCKKVKMLALETCNLTDEYVTIINNISIYASVNADEFVAEAISSSKKSKLSKMVEKIFYEELEG